MNYIRNISIKTNSIDGNSTEYFSINDCSYLFLLVFLIDIRILLEKKTALISIRKNSITEVTNSSFVFFFF